MDWKICNNSEEIAELMYINEEDDSKAASIFIHEDHIQAVMNNGVKIKSKTFNAGMNLFDIQQKIKKYLSL